MQEDFESRLSDLARELVRVCTERGLRVSTAESLTAGLVASSMADVPGASAVLLGGAVTYCDQIKHKVLGVSEDTLRVHTAVSSETAVEMAQGSRELFSSDVAVSLTGYAGPGGGAEDDPVGTVYIGLAGPAGVRARRYCFAGDRMGVRTQAACAAIETLLAAAMETC